MGQAKSRGTFEQRQAQAGLLNLATAITGRVVDMDMVQITDQEGFGRLNEVMQEVVTRLLANNTPMSKNNVPMEAWEQDDGRLTIQFVMGSGFRRIVEIPSGGWRELSAAQLEDISRTLNERADQNPDEHEQLIETLSDQITNGAASLQSREQEAKDMLSKATLALFVYDKSPNSLIALQDLASKTAAMQERADQWLATDAQFLVCCIGQTRKNNWVAEFEHAPSLFTALPQIVAAIGAEMPSAMLYCQWLSEEPQVHLKQLWEKNHGLMI